ncbi:MAG TPA: hypothetical protein VGY97_08935, partial [Solirubrobacteraceae bacterium]|nr:hypothetical protein [Solirubrobacteraceae bacterium]
DAAGGRAQRDRYRLVGAGARVVDRAPQRIAVAVGTEVDDGLIAELISVESECCPFFELGWDPASRELAISVRSTAEAPALEAIAFALGLPS